MAMKHNLEFLGIYVSDAYVRIATITISSRNEVIDFVAHYMAPGSDVPFNILSYQCWYILSGENPVKQGYEYLKTLPEFAGAEDC